MHVWVRREASWRLLHVSEVIEQEQAPYGGTMIGAAGCINPCRTVPFFPATPVEKDVMDAWQAQQSGPAPWARIWEFGEAAFMLTLQSRAGERPFWASRVFERREGVWMMAESYQVAIEAMPPF